LSSASDTTADCLDKRRLSRLLVDSPPLYRLVI
jgi:hypothetical protein